MNSCRRPPTIAALLILLAFVAGACAAAIASGEPPIHFRGDDVVRARLLLDAPSAPRGGSVGAVVELTPAFGWHLYGPERGDAGQPPSITWIVPPGVRAGDVAWPRSTRVVTHGLTTYEYTGRTDLRVPLAIDGQAQTRQGAPLRADLNWLVCSNVCVPGHARVSTMLTILPGGGGIWSIAPYLGLAFLGGLLLNLMPCVFPVLSFKALRAIGEPIERRRRSALAHAAGVTFSCTALGAGLLGARAAGHAIGWGFQLQSPPVVAMLALLLLVLGLAMSGAFELVIPVSPALAHRVSGAGAFGDGVLVTTIASACIGPYMGAALSFALSASAPAAIGIFLVLGLGLALPQAVLTVIPTLLRWLPRPGPWVVTARRVLAIPLYVSAAWLAWVLALQTVAAPRNVAVPSAQTDAAFTTAHLAALRRTHQPVLVDVSAAWCITCQVNERIALARPEVTRKLHERHVTVLRGDWTIQDPQLTAYLRSLGSVGVPLYALYTRDGKVDVWPQLLTANVIIDHLNRA